MTNVYETILKELQTLGKAPYETSLEEVMVIMKNLLKYLNPSYARGKKVGFISYTDKKFNKESRLVLSTPRFLTRKLGLQNYLSENCIKKLTDKINKSLFKNVKIKIIKGKKITCAYEEAVGNHSCMTGDYAECTLLYEMNPNKIQMIIIKQGNDSARALLWKLDCNRFYVDRIYTCSGACEELLQSFAAKNDFLVRWNNVPTSILHVSQLKFSKKSIPYMDTFIYGTIRKNLLDVSALKGEYCLQETDGHLCDYNSEITCTHCGIDLCDEDVVYSYDNDEPYCDGCYQSLFTRCEKCDRELFVDDAYTLMVYSAFHHMVRSKSLCSDCVKKMEKEGEIIRCSNCKQCFLTTDVFHRLNSDNDICSVCQTQRL